MAFGSIIKKMNKGENTNKSRGDMAREWIEHERMATMRKPTDVIGKLAGHPLNKV